MTLYDNIVDMNHGHSGGGNSAAVFSLPMGIMFRCFFSAWGRRNIDVESIEWRSNDLHSIDSNSTVLPSHRPQ
jgi:hypothetical protein